MVGDAAVDDEGDDECCAVLEREVVEVLLSLVVLIIEWLQLKLASSPPSEDEVEEPESDSSDESESECDSSSLETSVFLTFFPEWYFLVNFLWDLSDLLWS